MCVYNHYISDLKCYFKSDFHIKFIVHILYYRNLFHANAARQKVMAKLENIEFILMDIFSHQIAPPLPSPLPTESTLPPVLLLPPSTSQQSTSQLHVHIPSELPAPVLLPPSTSQPPVLLPPSTSQQSISQLHIPSESPAPVLLPPSTSQPSNYKYYSPCDIEFLLDLDLPHTVDTITEYFNRINVFDKRKRNCSRKDLCANLVRELFFECQGSFGES